MVVHHWSDDGMVLYHRRSLVLTERMLDQLLSSTTCQIFVPINGTPFDSIDILISTEDCLKNNKATVKKDHTFTFREVSYDKFMN